MQFLYQSHDEGKTWEILSLPNNLTMTYARFNDGLAGRVRTDKNSWSCDDSSAVPILYQTVDGTKTWVKLAPLPDGLKPTTDANGSIWYPQFNFVDHLTGWAINHDDQLRTTTDGGKTWSPLQSVVHLGSS